MTYRIDCQSSDISTIIHTKKIYQYVDKTMTFTSSSDDHSGDYTVATSVAHVNYVDTVVSGPPSMVTILNTETGENEETPSAGKSVIKSTVSW